MPAFPVEPALEAAVVSHADDDTPRLVYADWLDENGDPDRAAFIRVQCKLADLPPDDPEWCALDVQEDVLIHRLTPRANALRPRLPEPFYYPHPLPRGALRAEFRRGFPSSVQYGRNPTTAEADLAELVTTTTCRDLEANQFSPARLADLAAAPSSVHLLGLSITFEHGWGPNVTTERTAALLKLTDSPVAPHLQRLEVGSSVAQHPLAGSAGFPALRRLRSDWSITPALLAAPWIRGLCHLRLRGEYGAICSESAVSAAGELSALHTLVLTEHTRSAHLAAARFPRLARLAYPGSRLLFRDFQALLTARWFAQLRSLDLSNADLGDRAIVALAKHPVARNLRDLRIGTNPFGKTGLNALSEPGAFPELVRLDLSLTQLNRRKATEADVAKFLARLAHPKLQSLHLTGQPVNDFGALVIAKNANLSGLRELRLGEGVTDVGWKALRACKHLRQTAII